MEEVLLPLELCNPIGSELGRGLLFIGESHQEINLHSTQQAEPFGAILEILDRSLGGCKSLRKFTIANDGVDPVVLGTRILFSLLEIWISNLPRVSDHRPREGVHGCWCDEAYEGDCDEACHNGLR